MVNHSTTDYDAIVVGAGFSGIRTLYELKSLDLTAKCYEAGSGVGGTWYWNRYPGARTDSEAWVYTFAFDKAELAEQLEYPQRYPEQKDVERYIGHVADRYDLRKQIQFNTPIKSAHYHGSTNSWTITTLDGESATCRYFIPATGPLSVGLDPPFKGFKSYKGEWYLASKWPKKSPDFRGKRVAIIGTGATGVQIIPKIAPGAKHLTVFQRTPNFVLPGRNYLIDEYHLDELKKNYSTTWDHAANHPFGLSMKDPRMAFADAKDEHQIRTILDQGWEEGGFHFQFETFSDGLTNQKANDALSDYLREKIRAVVRDPETAEQLCPRYPFMSKRPPCGHQYYETFNRPNVELVDVRENSIDCITETGVRTKSGHAYDFDMIIYAVGFDAGTGAFANIDIRNTSTNFSIQDAWSRKLTTYAGVLVPGFPNMFPVCGPHIPFGNMPVVLEHAVAWIGTAIKHLETNHLPSMEVEEQPAEEWGKHVEEVLNATILATPAKENHAWYVGANIEGKRGDVLFYFGGVPNWRAWLSKESDGGWGSMRFGKMGDGKGTVDGTVNGDGKVAA